jgi:hypothetical protein
VSATSNASQALRRTAAKVLARARSSASAAASSSRARASLTANREDRLKGVAILLLQRGQYTETFFSSIQRSRVMRDRLCVLAQTRSDVVSGRERRIKLCRDAVEGRVKTCCPPECSQSLAEPLGSSPFILKSTPRRSGCVCELVTVSHPGEGFLNLNILPGVGRCSIDVRDLELQVVDPALAICQGFL